MTAVRSRTRGREFSKGGGGVAKRGSCPMGKRGPKPQPTAVKRARGNPGKRTLNTDEPTYSGGAKCPAWLRPEAKKEWKRLAPELESKGLLTTADQNEFAKYCQAFARWKELEAMITKASMELAIAKGYVNASIKQQQVMDRLAAKFGFTPSDRTGIKAPKPNAGDDKEKGFFPGPKLVKHS